MLCVIATERNKLLADRATTIGFSLATLSVLDNTFHLLARRQGTVCISTLACMDQGLDAALDAETTRVSWALSGGRGLVAVFIIQTKTKLLHLVLVGLGVVTCDAEVIILYGRKHNKRNELIKEKYRLQNPTLLQMTPNSPHRQYSGNVSLHGACTRYRCRQSGPGFGYATPPTCTLSSTWTSVRS